jgi:hypothetical protein
LRKRGHLQSWRHAFPRQQASTQIEARYNTVRGEGTTQISRVVPLHAQKLRRTTLLRSLAQFLRQATQLFTCTEIEETTAQFWEIFIQYNFWQKIRVVQLSFLGTHFQGEGTIFKVHLLL